MPVDGVLAFAWPFTERGEAGSLVLRELLGHPVERFRMIGFIDDDPASRWLRLQGIPCLAARASCSS